MATVTYSTQHPMQPKYGPNRSWNIEQTIVSSATSSAGDVWILNELKIPHGAVVTNIELRGSVVDGSYIFETGTHGSGSTADVFGSTTLSATLALVKVVTTGLPYTVSVSDDATLRYQTFLMRVDGAATSGTTSVSLNINIKYYTR